MDKRIEALIDFLDNAHSVFHAVAGLEKTLLDAGYQALNEWDAWDLIPGGKYYLKRNDSAILAFRIPQGNPKGFLLSASHADRP